ncbi:HAD-like protein [Aspergillus campestris IBT 28561]|uniref:HAD-like protein n=1 Tax=Aspergillus campestris (strain IBT 28561) TaxID=1392248 RepID=A0A2I1D7G3_ASPC2|nr:HAD-like protein [Aspergillus campestris IBT 28561]PKY05793.1 HAD-like protein [Aspergillus campestris IBT 28561]
MSRFKPTEANVSHIVFDLGGVFTDPPSNDVLLPTEDSLPVSVRRLTSTSTWMAYECGKLEEEECYQLLANQYGLQKGDLATAIQKGREASDYDHDLVAGLWAFKKSTPGVRLIMASNISLPDYTALQERWGPPFWSLFDYSFPSCKVGVRKPSPRFYRHLLRNTGASPSQTVFVDDRPENVLAAAGLGCEGFFSRLRMRSRGRCGVWSGTLWKEVLLILDTTSDSNLVELKRPQRFWNFFSGTPKYTTTQYPDDVDTTSLALASMPYSPEVVHSILDEMLDYVDEDGLVQLYLDRSRPRVDAVICLNVLTLFCIHSRGYQLPETTNWIQDILLHRAYLNGTRYYPTAEWFLYYLSRLLVRTDDQTLRDRFEAPLKQRIKERIGAGGDALCLAMRLLVCSALGIANPRDVETLRVAQLEDGGWEASFMYRFPGMGKELGNRGVTTAFAVRALQEQAGFERGGTVV